MSQNCFTITGMASKIASITRALTLYDRHHSTVDPSRLAGIIGHRDQTLHLDVLDAGADGKYGVLIRELDTGDSFLYEPIDDELRWLPTSARIGEWVSPMWPQTR